MNPTAGGCEEISKTKLFENVLVPVKWIGEGCRESSRRSPTPSAVRADQPRADDDVHARHRYAHRRGPSGAVVLGTGFALTPTDAKAEYGAGQLANVVNALVVERLLAPTGPYGHVLRPGDGKEPESIAYVQCAGSRDQTLGVEYWLPAADLVLTACSP